VAENVLHSQGIGAWPVCGRRGRFNDCQLTAVVGLKPTTAVRRSRARIS